MKNFSFSGSSLNPCLSFFPLQQFHNPFDLHHVLFSLCTIPTPCPCWPSPQLKAKCSSGLRLRNTLLPDYTFSAAPITIGQRCCASLPCPTTRRPDSCVSLRLRLHDTQLPYSISCHTTSFRQRCKGRTPAQASGELCYLLSSHKCHTSIHHILFIFHQSPFRLCRFVKRLSAAYPHTPLLCSGVFRYSTIRLTNLVRCDDPAAPNGSARKINAPSVRLAILSHLTRLHSL